MGARAGLQNVCSLYVLLLVKALLQSIFVWWMEWPQGWGLWDGMSLWCLPHFIQIKCGRAGCPTLRRNIFIIPWTVSSAGLVLHKVGACIWQEAIRNLSAATRQIIYSNFIHEFSLLFLPCKLLRKPRKCLQCICKVVSAYHLWSGEVGKAFL